MLLPNPNMIDRFACARVNGLKDETFESMMRENNGGNDYKQNYYNSTPRLQNCINEIVDEPSELTNINSFGNQQKYNKTMTSNLDNSNFAADRRQNMITQAYDKQQINQQQTKEGYEMRTNDILGVDIQDDDNNNDFIASNKVDNEIMYNVNNKADINNINGYNTNNTNGYNSNVLVGYAVNNKCNYNKSFFDRIHRISNRDIFIIIISLICLAVFFTIIGITIYRNNILNNKLDNVMLMVQMNAQNNQQLSQEQKEINDRIQKNIYDKADNNNYNNNYNNINQPIFPPPQEQRVLSPQVPIKQPGFL